MIPGPVDRLSFFAEQHRRRRQTWRHTALCAVAAAVVGMPMAMFISPIAYLVLVLGLRQVQKFVAIPASTWQALRDIAGVIPAMADSLGDVPDMGLFDTIRYVARAFGTVSYPFDSWWLTLAALVLPGMATTTLVWLGYRALLRRAGVGGMLLKLGARAPHSDDLEERQLVNLVEEMAIAGGLPAPQVRVLDSRIPNAVAIGSGPDRAVVIVTRGLLDELDRDETQGIIAHAVASIGNGDLPIALSITTVFQTVELIFTGFDALLNLSGSAWRDLFLVARCALFGGRNARASEAVSHLLDRRIGEFRDDGIQGVLADAGRDRPQTFLGKLFKRLPMFQVVFFPFLIFYVLSLLLRMQVWLVRFTVVGPLMMRVWRTRRHLADATAVQLTRHPDGLARGLAHLAAEGGVVPGGQWFSHLFVVGPEAAQMRKDTALQQRLRSTGQEAGDRPMAAAAQVSRILLEHAAEERTREKAFTEELGGARSHPPISARLDRLAAQGATRYRPDPLQEARPPARAGLRPVVSTTLGMLIITPLVAIAGVLSVFAFSAIFMFGVLSAMMFTAATMALLVPLMR
ncbi:MAG: M48 family metalloprotease [Luteitalea sp.]|nr:M48 family metalloprotease [Luteitalea sp.]